jgi:hypothetical protein
MTIDNVTIQNTLCNALSTFRAFTILQKTHKKRPFEYMSKFIFCHLPHSVGNQVPEKLYLGQNLKQYVMKEAVIYKILRYRQNRCHTDEERWIDHSWHKAKIQHPQQCQSALIKRGNENVDIKFSAHERFWNNLHQVAQNQKIGKPNNLIW